MTRSRVTFVPTGREAPRPRFRRRVRATGSDVALLLAWVALITVGFGTGWALSGR